MNPLLHMISLVSATTAGALFSAIWEGAVLAASVALCLRLIPRLSAAARSVVWTNVFLLLALLHVLPFIGQHWTPGNGISYPPLHLDLDWSVAIAGVWAMLSLWRGVQLILSAIRLQGLGRRATPIHCDATLQTFLDDQAGDRMSGRSAELCSSAEVERPSVIGFFQPRILLPQGLAEKLSALELRQVLLHEMEHLRRADDWTNLIQKIVRAIFFFHPAVWWIESHLAVEREMACDDAVLAQTSNPRGYATCLVSLLEKSLAHRLTEKGPADQRWSMAQAAVHRASEAALRLARILDSNRPSATRVKTVSRALIQRQPPSHALMRNSMT